MFPNVDPDVCEVVFQVNECRLYAAIEKLLEISDPSFTNLDSSNDNDNNGNDNGNNIESVNAARNDGEYYNSISGQGGDPEKDELYTAAT